LLKALRKEPERRYSGVTAFADDLRRYLEGRPVRARPATLGYRASRFVQRNKPGVAAGVILLAMLLGGIAATSVQKARAEKRFNEVRKLANAVLFDYHDAIASLPGSTAVRERLIKDALDYLDNLSRQAARDTGLLREVAAAYQKAGQIQGNSYYSNLGDTEGAMKSYRASLKIRQDLLAAAPHDPELQQETAASHEGVGDIHYAIGDLRAGLEGYERALEIRQGLTRGRPADLRHALALAQLYSRLGDIRGLEGYANLGDTAGALANHRKAYQILEPLAAAHPQDQDSQSTFANAVASSSMLALTTGDVEEALRTARRAVAHAEQLAAADENNQNSRIFLLKAKGILRYAQVDNNQLAEAIEGSKSVISDLQEMIVTDPKNNSFRRDLSVTHNALGKDLLSAGDGAGAIENHRSALAICESALAAEPNSEDSKSDVAFTLQRLGQAQAAQGESAAALENFRRALAMREPTTNADPSNARAQEDVLTLRVDIGKTLVKGGDFSEAIEAFRKAIPPAEALSKRDPTHARHQARLALTYSDLGQAHLGLARSGGRDGTKTVDDGRQAGEHFARSLALWQELRDRNALVPANEPRLKEAELGLAECDAAKL
jgi:tetratricopeptide (TPR) repeat protein